MKKSVMKVFCSILTIVLISGVLGACVNKEEGQPAATSVKSASTIKTTAKTVSTSSASAIKSVAASVSSVTFGTTASTADTGEGQAATSEQDGLNDNTDDRTSEDGNDVQESKVYDLKGREIRLMASQVNLKESQARPFEDPDNKLNTLRYNLMKEAEKKYNCKFVFNLDNVTVANTRQKFDQEMMAGIPQYDAYRLQPLQILPAYEKNNMILVLNNYIDFNQPVWQKFFVKHATGLIYPQNIYGLMETQISSVYAIWYNTEILARNNIPNLIEIKEAGMWNWETFLDIAIRTTQDTDGNGIIDQWGLVAPTATYAGQSFLWSNLEPVVMMKNGQYTYNLGSANGMKALQFVSDLYNTYQVIPNKNGENMFRDNLAAMCIREAWYGLTWKSYGKTNVKFEEMPKGPDNPGVYNVKNWSTAQYYFFPASVSDAEAVINAFAYWHVLWDETKPYWLEYDVIAYEYGKNYMFTDYVDNYIKVKSRKDIDEFGSYFGTTMSKAGSEVFTKIATVNTTAASAIEALKPVVEGIIAETMSK